MEYYIYHQNSQMSPKCEFWSLNLCKLTIMGPNICPDDALIIYGWSSQIEFNNSQHGWELGCCADDRSLGHLNLFVS